jgi:transglutaminase-like putative cysteine protease
MSLRLSYSVELAYDIHQPDADFIFNIQAARTPRQHVVQETLTLDQPVPVDQYTDPVNATRLLRLRSGVGRLTVRHAATVDLRHLVTPPQQLPETWVCNLPGAVLPYLYPSRFCESDLLSRFAMQQFGSLWQGYSRVEAIRAWVQHHVGFVSGSSEATTTALHTFQSRQGVCRDFAHLMIALCRALNIPARFVTGLDYGADPALGPTDFHAYVEAYLGNAWYIFDPSGTATPMGLIRLGTGRDAADCAYATIFGAVSPVSRWLTVAAEPGADGMLREPQRGELALSTDA